MASFILTSGHILRQQSCLLFADDERELNGHHGDHEDIKRQRSLAYNNSVDAYSNMWTAAAAGKWGAMVKEEPKGSGPGNVHSSLSELLSSNPTGQAPPPAPSSGGSPHQFTYGSPNPGSGFPDVVFTSSVTTPSDLIYDSINMTQVQNYSPSLSSSLGKLQLFRVAKNCCFSFKRLSFFLSSLYFSSLSI